VRRRMGCAMRTLKAADTPATPASSCAMSADADKADLDRAAREAVAGLKGPDGAKAAKLLELARELIKADPKRARLERLSAAITDAIENWDRDPAFAYLADVHALPAAVKSATISLAVEAAIQEHIEEIVRHLRALEPAEYELRRRSEAGRLGIRTAALDDLVQGTETEKVATGSGAALDLHDPDPWPQPVDGGALLDELAAAFRRFAILPLGADVAIVLWVLFTYLIAVFDIAPRLGISSPARRCGKTTLLNVLAHLVPRPLVASNISPAAIFRTIDAARPTLLIDEADSFARENEELRGILNSGHSRASAFVVRLVSVADDFEPRKFSTYTAMAIARIGHLPATLEDREITLALRRRLPSERIERFRREHAAALAELARRCARWAADHAEALKDADPAVPSELDDRAGDNWRPLLAIADAAGGEWQERAQAAALLLSGADVRPEGSIGVILLGDLRSIFAEREADRLGSAQICEALAAMEGRPWAEYRRGRAMSPNQLARALRPFDVSPITVQLADGANLKGYKVGDFKEAFTRYLPNPDSTRRSVKTLGPQGGSDDFQTVNGRDVDGLKNAANPNGDRGFDASTVEKPQTVEAERF